MGLLPGDLEKVPQNFSIRDCYKRIYEWHKKYGKQRLIVKQGKRGIKDAYSRGYLALLEKLHHPDEISESCMDFVFNEVICMLMEWSYHQQDEYGIKMGAYAHFAINKRYEGIGGKKFRQSKEKRSLYKDIEYPKWEERDVYANLSIRVSKEQLKQKISEEFNIPKEKVDDNLLKATIGFFKKSGGEVWERWERLEHSLGHEKTMALMAPVIYYTINVKKFVWTLAGVLLDLYITKGLATGVLTAFGVVGQCIAKLIKENGEICVYKELWRKGTKTMEEIYNSLIGKDCPFKDFACTYRNESGFCIISTEDIKEDLRRMKESGVVTETKDKKWKAEFWN